MKQTEPLKLLRKLKDNNCSDSEYQILLDSFSDKSTSQFIKQQMIEELENFETERKDSPRFRRIWKSIEHQSDIQKKEKSYNIVQFKMTKMLRVAAIVIVSFTCGILGYYFVVSMTVQTGKEYCEIVAPLGARSQVKLPDGSEVWINAGSRIRYASDFNSGNRDVKLEGEAYFKVAKNEDLAFVVSALGVKIKALGTEFNVKAYSEEGIVETTLIEGKVTLEDTNGEENEVKKVLLKPNQKAFFIEKGKEKLVKKSERLEKVESRSHSDLTKTIYIAPQIDPNPVIAWRENRLLIKGETLSDLAVLLERKFNVNILFAKDEIKDYRFSGSLEDESLQQILDVVKLTSPISYQIDGKDVVITLNKSTKEQFDKYMRIK